jgi:hypothetical protein
MKRVLAAVCSLVTTTSMLWAAGTPGAGDGAATPASTVAQNWSATFASEVRYFSWKSSLSYPPGSADAAFSGSGSEIYIPYALQLVGQPNDNVKIEIVGRGGWVRARQTSGDRNGQVSAATDTQVSATATYLGINGIQPFVSVNFNVPTGKARLSSSEANARMDPDLVDIASFGEGFNFGPTIGVSLAIANNLIATFSVGYTQRGTYTRDGSLNPLAFPATATSEVEPGDVTTATASVGYQEGQLTGNITGSVSTETDTKADGQRYFRAGVRYFIGGTWAYTWPETWGVTTLSASAAHADKSKVLFVLATPLYVTEPFNSSSNVYRIGIDHLFPFGTFWVGPTASFLYRDHNGYNAQTLQFVPAKNRWSAGLSARNAVNDKVTFNARVERIWIHENTAYPGSPFSVLTNTLQPIQGMPAISSNGWQGSIGADVGF